MVVRGLIIAIFALFAGAGHLAAADMGDFGHEPRQAPRELAEVDGAYLPRLDPADPRKDSPLEWPLPTLGPGGALVPAETPEQVSSVLWLLGALTILTIAPSLLMLMTSFLRILIVMSFLRRALGTQTLPPDQVMVGLTLFLTFFIMWPTWKASWDTGIAPYMNGDMVEVEPGVTRRLRQSEAIERAMEPNRRFMLECLAANRGKEELVFFLGASGRHDLVEKEDRGELRPEEVDTVVLIPAFLCSELKRSFWMGFLLYLPFLILDVVISSILMSMGMMMLPPMMVSLPFKIVLFVLVDGWRLLMEGIVSSFPVEVLERMLPVAPL